MSLLERLMTQCELYQKDEKMQYNPTYITKLVNNYRSHKSILHVPNRLFYDNELKVRTLRARQLRNDSRSLAFTVAIRVHILFGRSLVNQIVSIEPWIGKVWCSAASRWYFTVWRDWKNAKRTLRGKWTKKILPYHVSADEVYCLLQLF